MSEHWKGLSHDQREILAWIVLTRSELFGDGDPDARALDLQSWLGRIAEGYPWLHRYTLGEESMLMILDKLGLEAVPCESSRHVDLNGVRFSLITKEEGP